MPSHERRVAFPKKAVFCGVQIYILRSDRNHQFRFHFHDCHKLISSCSRSNIPSLFLANFSSIAVGYLLSSLSETQLLSVGLNARRASGPRCNCCGTLTVVDARNDDKVLVSTTHHYEWRPRLRGCSQSHFLTSIGAEAVSKLPSVRVSQRQSEESLTPARGSSRAVVWARHNPHFPTGIFQILSYSGCQSVSD